jgi:flagellar hook-associated protein 1 FlgK
VSFFGIRLASRALQAHQRALEVTGQNIANVNTPGYSRQAAVLGSVSGPGAATLDRAGSPLAIGGGVDTAQVLRTHAAWLDRTAAVLTGRLGQGVMDERIAGQVERLLAEPTETGLQATLDRFFTAFGSLADRPDDLAARSHATRTAAELAQRFQQLTEGVETLQRNLVELASDTLDGVNLLAEQVASLSTEIRLSAAAGASPNELMDQRDQILNEIVRRTGASVSGQESGEVVVSIAGRTLVQGEAVFPLQLASDGSLRVVTPGGEDVEGIGGELGAMRDWTAAVLTEYRSRIAAIRDGLAGAVNALHGSGKDLDGAPGESFFLTDAEGNLAVNPVLLQDPRRLAAGDGSAGDGGVARAIAGLRNADGSGMAPGSGVGTPTPTSAYRALVAEIGERGNESRRRLEHTEAALQQVRAVQASESGVNLDEELAQMVSVQHAYTASARLLATYDELLATLIERTGA